MSYSAINLEKKNYKASVDDSPIASPAVNSIPTRKKEKKTKKVPKNQRNFLHNDVKLRSE